LARGKISFAWLDGFIIVSAGGDELVIRAANTTITLAPREIVVEGLFEGIREKVEGRRGERKAVYVDFAFPIRGVSEPEGVVFKGPVDTYAGPYGLSYTVLPGVGHYLTIYPPGGALYDHAVLAEDFLMLYMLARRQLYVMEEGAARKIILV